MPSSILLRFAVTVRYDYITMIVSWCAQITCGDSNPPDRYTYQLPGILLAKKFFPYDSVWQPDCPILSFVLRNNGAIHVYGLTGGQNPASSYKVFAWAVASYCL